MAETLIENLRKSSESAVIFVKQRPQTLHVALFILCYVFQIVFIKHKQNGVFSRIQLCKGTYIKYQWLYPISKCRQNSARNNNNPRKIYKRMA